MQKTSGGVITMLWGQLYLSPDLSSSILLLVPPPKLPFLAAFGIPISTQDWALYDVRRTDLKKTPPTPPSLLLPEFVRDDLAHRPPYAMLFPHPLFPCNRVSPAHTKSLNPSTRRGSEVVSGATSIILPLRRDALLSELAALLVGVRQSQQASRSRHSSTRRLCQGIRGA